MKKEQLYELIEEYQNIFDEQPINLHDIDDDSIFISDIISLIQNSIKSKTKITDNMLKSIFDETPENSIL
jgi:hypothetical protein